MVFPYYEKEPRITIENSGILEVLLSLVSVVSHAAAKLYGL